VCGDGQKCPETEACDDGFKDACGTCNADCTAAGTPSVCGDGVVCQETETCDTGASNGCGACNDTCDGPGVVCSACADGTVEQTFNNGMAGCSGKVTFANRATLCATGYKVCTSSQWMNNRGTAGPTYHYWVNDAPMYWKGTDSYGTQCAASSAPFSGGGMCKSADAPMRVCAGNYDPLNNVCNWKSCGWINYTPNQYFGGCDGNTTAGALCCPNP
jgi:hypothetical protein